MSEPTDEQKRQFLLDLTELTRKHGIAVGGCGCCGSPFLMEADCSDERAGYSDSGRSDFSWIAPSDKYDWEHYSDGIVRAADSADGGT